MKIFYTSFIFLFTVSFLYGQDTIINNLEKNYIEVNPFDDTFKGFSNVDHWAKYPGGKQGILQHIEKNLRYPDEAKKEVIEGTITLEYTIDTNGFVGEIRVIDSDHPLLEDEAIRVIRLMDKWLPSVKEDKPIKTKYKQVFNFKL